MSNPSNPLEFQLIVELTHPHSEDRHQIIRALLENKIDWSAFFQQVAWHRVIPQVYGNVNAYKELIPESTIQRLRQATISCRNKSLLQTSKIVGISQLLGANEIQFLVLKGVALSKYLYDDYGRRQGKDIDILIDEADLSKVEKLLIEELGFERTQPAPDASIDEINYSNRNTKDRIYQHAIDQTEIEVHWRFAAEKPLLAIPFSELMRQSFTLEFHGKDISVLNDNFLWLYQSFHGTYSGWYRLHWVSDIAELFTQKQPDWEKLLSMAKEYNCQNCLIEAVVLTCEIYQFDLPAVFQDKTSKTLQTKYSLPFARHALIHTHFMNPIVLLWRALFWLPSKYYYLFVISRMAQTPRGDSSWYKEHPIRSLGYILLRPFSLLIRQFR